MPSPNMSSNIIVFHCPNCGSKLQVPAKMAGVTGPCPSCHAGITAPATSEQAAESSGDAAPVAMEPEASASQKPLPAQQPAPQPDQADQPGDQAAEASGFKPLSAVKPEAGEATGQGQKPPPSRAFQPANPAAASADFSNYKVAQTAVHRMDHGSGQRPGWARWMSVIFPLIFLAAACIVILAVLHLTGLVNVSDHHRVWASPSTASPDASTAGPESPAASADEAGQAPSQTSPPDPESADAESAPADADAAATAAPAPPAPPAVATPEPVLPDPAAEEPGELVSQTSENPQQEQTSPGLAPTATTADAPIPQEPVSDTAAPAPLTAGALANHNLEQFLQAKTLAERQPLMSGGGRPAQQPGASCLDGELKPVKSLRLLETVPRGKDLIQYFYSVSFEDQEEDRQRQRVIMQLTERPGVHPPLVHTDAFLQHYNKELAQYATQGEQTNVVTFHCIAEARTSALSEHLPEELKKDMVRLLIKTHPYNDAVFNAYVSKKSPLMAHIGSGKDLPYTRARYCVLSFLWNTTHPGHPYIELKDIVTMTWEK